MTTAILLFLLKKIKTFTEPCAIFKYMARPLLIPNPENATLEELKQISRIGSNQTATRCTAIQMLLAGANRDLVCNALLVTNRALRKWINRFQSLWTMPPGIVAKLQIGTAANQSTCHPIRPT